MKFHNGAELTPEDVEYTFERAMLADPAGGPIWMFFEPLLGVQTMRDVIAMAGGPRDFANVNDVDPAILRAAYDIVDATVEVDGDYVVFNLVAPYPPFLQILAKGGSWGAIINKEWTAANGGWDGNPDTWQNWYNLAKEEMALYNKAMGTGALSCRLGISAPVRLSSSALMSTGVALPSSELFSLSTSMRKALGS